MSAFVIMAWHQTRGHATAVREFEQLDADRSSFRGTGLGLALTENSRIAESSIQLRASSPGQHLHRGLPGNRNSLWRMKTSTILWSMTTDQLNWRLIFCNAWLPRPQSTGRRASSPRPRAHQTGPCPHGPRSAGMDACSDTKTQGHPAMKNICIIALMLRMKGDEQKRDAVAMAISQPIDTACSRTGRRLPVELQRPPMNTR